MRNRGHGPNITVGALVCAVFAALFVLSASGVAYATTEHPVVVSLGDSYSSGEGVEPFYGQDSAWTFFREWKEGESYEQYYDWLAHRSEGSWPGRLTVTNSAGIEVTLSDVKGGGNDADWYFVASSGATTYEIKGEQAKVPSGFHVKGDDEETEERTLLGADGSESLSGDATLSASNEIPTHENYHYVLPAQLSIFEQLEYGSVDYVTLTLGGNDMGFSEILTEAAIGSWALVNPDGVYEACAEKWKEWPDVRQRLEQAYRDIQESAGPQATIIVAGYPHLIDDESGSHLTVTPLEAQEINTNVTLLNARIKALVDELRENSGLNIYFVSVEERFDGHEAYSDDPYLNEVIIGAEDQDLNQACLVSAYSIHPNEKGTAAYAKAVQQLMDYLEDTKANPTFGLPEGSVASDGKTRDVALVLDTSASMEGDPIEEVRRATVRFGYAMLGMTAKVGVVAFWGDAEVVQTLTYNNALISMAAEELEIGSSTNIGAGLTTAASMLSGSTADRKIIILMSDGEPNMGMDEEELVAYADMLKEQGYYIYTLGFFSAMDAGSKSEPQQLLERIASEGCHYEVANASELQFFFGDIADQINGVRYNYIRIACPVDVTVTYDGETLSSSETDDRARTSFGTLTFEDEAIDESQGNEEAADAIKVLRLREGPDYEVSIRGTGTGTMDYAIGFVDNEGEYNDMRYFDAIGIGPRTHITTRAKVSDLTRMTVDFDGDGEIDETYEAQASSHAELVDNSRTVQMVTLITGATAVLIAILFVRSLVRIRRH